MEILGVIALWFGIFFSFVGIVGIIRLPDVYSRLHSSGKVSTLGVFGLLVASAILLPSTAVKAIVLGGFLILTAPVASHLIALAAHRLGCQMQGAVRDDLKREHPVPEQERQRLLDETSA
jgi:multicomponent Na+:H+ antiporter subunit G